MIVDERQERIAEQERNAGAALAEADRLLKAQGKLGEPYAQVALAGAIVAELRAFRYTLTPEPLEPVLVSDARTSTDVEGWAIVELMGHRVRRGLIRTITVAYRDFVEVRSWSEAQMDTSCASCGHAVAHDHDRPCSSLVRNPDTPEGELAPGVLCSCTAHERVGRFWQGFEPERVEIYSPAAIFAIATTTEEAVRAEQAEAHDVPF